MIYDCCSDARKIAVQRDPFLNGIDFLEVLGDSQTTLKVHFLKPLKAGSLGKSNVFIEGGDRIKNIQVDGVERGPVLSVDFGEEVLIVNVTAPGDFSDYILRLAIDSRHPEPPAGFDKVLSSVVFSFKVTCQNEFDCQTTCDCPPESFPVSPDINYLARDYATFRQLMLDRMSLLVPNWRERNPADLGIVLVELLAYAADYMSYRQDALSTEAYLGTARKRTSVRRHARLVDYFMHDGCNARAWLHIRATHGTSGVRLSRGSGNNTTKVLSRMNGLPPVFGHYTENYKKAFAGRPKVFELMHDIILYSAHNEMKFYTWGDKSCCLPKGATKATLSGHFPHLRVGDVLIFAEKKGPDTGKEQDADPLHRHAVRLTQVKLICDTLFDAMGNPFDNVLGSPPYYSPPTVSSLFSPPFESQPNRPSAGSPPLNPPGEMSLCEPYFKVTEISWHALDALPFPLCISTDSMNDVSVALGNIVLVDHGMTFEDIGKVRSLSPSVVPSPKMQYALAKEGCHCDDKSVAKGIPIRFRPKLKNGPLTVAGKKQFLEGYEASASAAELIHQSPCGALPSISLAVDGIWGEQWHPKSDLLQSNFNKQEFVVETESDGASFLRFGDDQFGARPNAGMDFIATYRLGNGEQGNVGADTLAHLVSGVDGLSNTIDSISNPLAAEGGTDPESMEEVKQFAPQAFRIQERAVTPQDYEQFAKRCRLDVQKVAATMRWTGSWRTFFLSADRMGGLDVDAAFETDLRSRLERYRMAGFDLKVDSPLYVPLEIEISVCIKSDFFASNVKKALLEVFSNQLLPSGKTGLFHPDNFSFGQAVFSSPLIAAAMRVAGVASVKLTKFQRQGRPDPIPLEEGKLTLGRREIARCDNDPNFPDRGVFSLVIKGGK